MADAMAEPRGISTVTFVINGEQFSLSKSALSVLGSACMLNQMINHAGTSDDKHVVTWPSPLTVRSFALVVEWASTGRIPKGIPSRDVADVFRAADALCITDLASRCLALGPPPSSFDTDNGSLLEIEAPYFVHVDANTFIARSEAVNRSLAIGDSPLLFRRQLHEDRAHEPLFRTPSALAELLEQKLPPEARLCLAQGMCLAGGFAARLAASLAGLCKLPQHEASMSSSSSHAARPDIDFFLTTADSAEGLRVVRATLIALARYCEEHQIGMCVVRSPYAITVAMDDCDYDLQIVLCAFDSMEDVLSNFDIDACRIAYDGTRLLVSETFLRALVSGVVIARPQNESANHAKRLHKYATELGYSIAISDHDPAKPGRTFKQLKALEDASVVPHAHPPPSQLQISQIQIVREWEASFVTTPQVIEDVSQLGREPLSKRFPWQHPVPLPLVEVEVEQGPSWTIGTQERTYVAPPVKRPSLLREQLGQFDYQSGSSREIVEVWRGQRRRGPFGKRGDLETIDFWRYVQAARLAFELSAGPVAWTPSHPNLDESDQHDANLFCFKGVVFQQLDMHPVRGAWNGKQKAFLADATSSMPLVFLDFIEDAALVVPKGFREKLPRRLHVPMRDEAGSVMFSRPPAGDAHWAA